MYYNNEITHHARTDYLYLIVKLYPYKNVTIQFGVKPFKRSIHDLQEFFHATSPVHGSHFSHNLLLSFL